MKLLPLALAAGAALASFGASADGPGGSSSAAGCAAADATCFSANRGNRPTGALVSAGAPATGATPNCLQGSADSTCALPSGVGFGAYGDPSAVPTPTPCRALPASQWTGGCPVGQIGAITYQADYSCGYQKVYLQGSLTPTLMIAEPGQYGPGYPIANTCANPTPPTPPTPTYTRIYLLSIDTFETTSTSRVTVTIQRANADGSAQYLLSRAGPWYNVDLMLPWGFDYRPMYGPSDGANNADAMRPPMQFFIDKGCKLVSDDPSLRYNAAAAYAQSFGGLTVWKSLWYGGFGDGYTNYAFCPNDVGIG